MWKLMIADGSETFVSALEHALCQTYQLRSCKDGDTALEMLEQFQPDILVINLMLPYTDGLTVLQQTTFRPSVILAITAHLSSYVEHTVADLGVDYVMIMPSIRVLCLRIADLIQKKALPQDCKDAQSVTAHHLRQLNIPSHLEGYQQLLVAIPRYAEDPHQFMTKELYPAVAKICGCRDGRSVEHSIRNAIQTGWSHRNNSIWRKYFTPGPRGQVTCPSNKEFICQLAELLNTPCL